MAGPPHDRHTDSPRACSNRAGAHYWAGYVEDWRETSAENREEAMTDAELIKAVAKKAGWAWHDMQHLSYPGYWTDENDIDYYTDELPSVDAAMELIKGYDYRINKAAMTHIELFKNGESISDGLDDLLPCAILLAFLEAPHD